jgi:hypothetical protein
MVVALAAVVERYDSRSGAAGSSRASRPRDQPASFLWLSNFLFGCLIFFCLGEAAGYTSRAK